MSSLNWVTKGVVLCRSFFAVNTDFEREVSLSLLKSQAPTHNISLVRLFCMELNFNFLFAFAEIASCCWNVCRIHPSHAELW